MIKSLFSLTFIFNLLLTSIFYPMSPAWAVFSVEDLPGYSTANVMQANPQLIRNYFIRRPDRLERLGGEAQLTRLFASKNFDRVAVAMEHGWLGSTVLNSVLNETLPSVSWLYGMPANVDWRETYNQSPQIQRAFEDLSCPLDFMPEELKKIAKATFIQEWIIASQYEVKPLNLDTEPQPLRSSFLASVESPSNTAPEFYSIIADHYPRAREKGLNPIYVSHDDLRSNPSISRGAGSKFIVMTGRELFSLTSEEKKTLKSLFDEAPLEEGLPTTTLLVDVKREDGLVDAEGVFSLSPTQVDFSESLWLSNNEHDVTEIEIYFLCDFLNDCFTLKVLDFSPFGNVTKIGSGFLSRCHALRALDLSSFGNVTQIGGGFLSYCSVLTALDLSPFGNVTEIRPCFLSQCHALRALDLSSFGNVTKIGGDFLSYCHVLKDLDLSSFGNVTEIGKGFLSRCHALRALDLSSFGNVTKIGEGFLSRCYGLRGLDLTRMCRVRLARGLIGLGACNNLVDIHVSDQTSKSLLRGVVKFLRESNNPVQQELGQRLYQEYLLDESCDALAAQRPFYMDNIRTNTPKGLEDIPDLNGLAVVEGYDGIMAAVGEMLDGTTRALYQPHLSPILQNLFVDSSVRVTWRMYEENKDELRVALKHILRKFQSMTGTLKGRQDVASDMKIFLEGFVHCQSRQAGDINQITGRLGLTGGVIEGTKQQHIWRWINEFKQEAFHKFVEGKDGAHEHMRAFTVVNNAVGLPVALRTFKERISRMSDEEIEEKLTEFLTYYFSPALLVDFIQTKLNEAQSTLGEEGERSQLHVMNIRGEMRHMEGEDGLDFVEYFEGLAGAEGGENFDPLESNLTKGEVRRLLELVRALKS